MKTDIELGREALNAWNKAFYEEKSIEAFQSLYEIIDQGEPDGWHEELLFDPLTNDFYLTYCWQIVFADVDDTQCAIAMVKITAEGVVTEIEDIPDMLIDISSDISKMI